jgi:16S rRNA G966 N2-methylase RsmD
VDFVERAPAALEVLRENVSRLGVTAGYRVHAGSVSTVLRRVAKSSAFDLVFLDPPYEAVQEYAATLGILGGSASELLVAGAAVIAEHRRKQRLDDQYAGLVRTRLLEQGDAALSFYAVANGNEAKG